MRIATVWVLATLTLAGNAFAQADGGAARATDGLVPMKSRMLDEVALRPDVDRSAYRKVIVEPARAELRKDWLKEQNQTRFPSRWLTQDDARQITDEAAVRASAVIANVFRDRGYEIATAPAAGVLRLSAAVTDLDVYAPDVPPPGILRYLQRDAGQATWRLEVRDAESGMLLARFVDRGTATEVRQINRASIPSNALWFDALFLRWATASAAAFAGAGSADVAAAGR